MKMSRLVLTLAAAAAASAAFGAGPSRSSLVLPGGSAGIGFDDLRFSEELGELLVPAGCTGRLDLVEPATGAIESVDGFSRTECPGPGHERGTTSADAGRGYVFAIDRTEGTLVVVEARAKRIVARARLGAGPDYVRWVGGASEVWITEPARGVIERFRFEGGPSPRLTSAGTIPVPDGPESLVVDPAGTRAYTNTFHGETDAIDVASHSVTERWPNHCRGARGIALDASRGLLFVGCEEGKAVALDVARGGSTIAEATTGEGVDVIAYGPRLRHLYVPAARSANLTVISVLGRGRLQTLGTMPTAPAAHCAAADDRGNVYVCDPRHGRVLVFHDPYPAAPTR